jgi:hypothetical protein
MRRLLLAFLVVACQAPAADAELDPTAAEQDLTKKEAFERLRPIATYANVELRSDGDVTDALARDVCTMARAAYDFDGALLGLAGRPVLSSSIVVGLGTDAILENHLGAATISADHFIAALSQFQTPAQSMPEYVTAHELTHMTMVRLGVSSGRAPIYVYEGIATSNGLWFVRQRRHTAGWPTGTYRAELALVTRADAEQVLQTFRVPSNYRDRSVAEVGHGEHVGALFVEYLRAHVVSRTHHAFGAITLRMSSGSSFEDAFAGEIGISVTEAEARFLTFVASTENNPAARFRGTVFDLS